MMEQRATQCLVITTDTVMIVSHHKMHLGLKTFHGR